MAQPSNTFDAYDAVGNREDLTDVIHNISPTTTPFMSNIKKGKATNILHEWQTESLAAVDGSNAVIDGDDASFDAVQPTVRQGNYAQISDKGIVVSGRQNSADSAGRKNEMAHQIAKKSKELKRDMENILLANNAKVAGNSTTAGELAGLESWLATNTNRGATGADPTGDGSDAATDGTQRAFTETQLKDVIQQCYDSGAEPDVIMVGSFNKQALSEFDGIATRYKNVEGNKPTAIIAGVDIYVSDFGELKVIPNRFQRQRSAFVLDTDMAKLAYYRPYRVNDIAKTGDSEKKQLIVDYTLEMCNEAAHGIVADLTTS